MRPPTRILAGSATAATLALCPIVASDATAATAHLTHSAAHATTAHSAGKARHTPVKKSHSKPVKKTHDRLAGQRRGVSHLIDAQLRAVTGLLGHTATATGPDAAGLATALTADRDALRADLGAVADATTKRQLVNLGRAAVRTRGVAATQARLVAALDAIAADADSAAPSGLLSSLQTQLSSLAGVQDVTALQTDLTAATNALTDLTAKVRDGTRAVLALAPTSGHPTVTAAARSATNDEAAATRELNEMTATLRTLQAYFA